MLGEQESLNGNIVEKKRKRKNLVLSNFYIFNIPLIMEDKRK